MLETFVLNEELHQEKTYYYGIRDKFQNGNTILLTFLLSCCPKLSSFLCPFYLLLKLQNLL